MPAKVTDPLSGALYAAELGLKVFPCKPKGKEPAVTHWQAWADASTPATISAYAAKHPNTNWGIHADGHAILDLDKKHGKNGIQEMRTLAADNPVVPTLIVETPSGGLHLYYSVPSDTPIRNSVSAIAPGIDVRTKGGYVVAPGSATEVGTYRIKSDRPIAPLPSWLLERATKRSSNASEAILGDIPQGERNAKAFSFAMAMRRKGFSQAAIEQALGTENDTRFQPPLSEAELARVISNCMRYAPEEVQAALAFEAVRTQGSILTPASTFTPETAPPIPWIMHKLLVRQRISLVIAPGGYNKTSLLLLAAVSCVTGHPYLGEEFEVRERCRVWFHNTEDPIDELHRRMAAIMQHYSIPSHKIDDLFISSGVETPLIFATENGRTLEVNQACIDYVIDVLRTERISLFAVDPFVSSHETDENNNQRMNRIMRILSYIAAKTNVAILVAHHSRKGISGDNEDGAQDFSRGASAIVDAARFAYALLPATAGGPWPAAERHRYLRLITAKANLLPPAREGYWFRRIGVPLPCGDETVTLQRQALPSAELQEEEARAQAKQDLATVLGHLLPGEGEIPWPSFIREATIHPLLAGRLSAIKGVARGSFLRALLEDGIEGLDGLRWVYVGPVGGGLARVRAVQE